MKEMVGSGDRELDKQLDLEGYSYDEIEPTNVKDAKAELQVTPLQQLVYWHIETVIVTEGTG